MTSNFWDTMPSTPQNSSNVSLKCQLTSNKVVNETVLRNDCLRCFIHILSQHVSAYLMAILMGIIQIIQRSCYYYYYYYRSVVFSTNLIITSNRGYILAHRSLHKAGCQNNKSYNQYYNFTVHYYYTQKS
jgi:hypothetical protein